MPDLVTERAPIVLGRYALYDRIASGGMATVHLGRLRGEVGFARTVAIKRLLPHYAADPEFVRMFLDESRIAARIQHPNVFATLDVVNVNQELFLVMEYVHGESFAVLLTKHAHARRAVPASVAVGIVADVLYGLHAAHEATSEQGEPLDLVHRDISPQNVLVGADGVARVLDFGVAKAAARIQTTQDGVVKGKLRYMSPEQVRQKPLDRRSDLFAVGVVLWEALSGRRLFDADDPASIMAGVVMGEISPPSAIRPELPTALDAVVLRALSREPSQRYPTARDMARALEAALAPASRGLIADWVHEWAGATLGTRASRIAEIESGSSSSPVRVRERQGPVNVTTEVRRRAEAQTLVTDGSVPIPGSTHASHESTELSSVGDAPGTSKRRRLLLASLFAIFVAALVFAARFWRVRDHTEAVREVGSLPVSTSSIEALTSTAPPVESAPENSNESAPPPSATVKSTNPRPRSSAPVRSTSPKVKSDSCNPPYRWDAERNIRVFKEECLR